MGRSKIEWTDYVWNPTIGCTKVSEGCRNCYAKRIYERYHPGQKFSDVRCCPGKLEAPKHWLKPRKIFVDSMSDLFHPKIPDTFIEQVFFCMGLFSWHTYIILTKRPERLKKWFNLDVFRPVLPNVWLGVSVEDQKTADDRIPILLQVPAAVHLVSAEPMLGPVDLGLYDNRYFYEYELTDMINKIDWVICGCESGPGARKMDLDWARTLKNQCLAYKIPFFFKQAEIEGKIVKMPALDGRVWEEFPRSVK